MKRSDATDAQPTDRGTQRKSFLAGVRRLLTVPKAHNDFDLDRYLATRERSPLESRFHREVQKVSDGRLSVEDVQKLSDSVHSKVEVMRILLMQLGLHTQRETDRFTHLFDKLWQHTPRTDLGGATPADQEREQISAVTASSIGRNDPCPCGSGKKYKNCCG